MSLQRGRLQVPILERMGQCEVHGVVGHIRNNPGKTRRSVPQKQITRGANFYLPEASKTTV